MSPDYKPDASAIVPQRDASSPFDRLAPPAKIELVVRKDLSERLRAIVKNAVVATEPRAGADAVARELTVEPDVRATSAHDLDGIADALGGRAVVEGGASLVVIDRVYDATMSHGRWPIEASRPRQSAPLDVFDAKAAKAPTWASRPVFFDTETTGLSGGAGTIAFLVGLGPNRYTRCRSRT